jgi:hypothetical protein
MAERIEKELEDRQKRLRGLGQPRPGPPDMREYLHDIFSQFHNITLSAVQGTYDGDFFANESRTTLAQDRLDPRRLRAAVNNLSHGFAAVMASRGSKFHIIGGLGVLGKRPIPDDRIAIASYSLRSNEQQSLLLTEMLSKIELMAINVGGLQSSVSIEKLALDLFRESAEPWNNIANEYIGEVMRSTKKFVNKVIRYMLPRMDGTRDRIQEVFIDSFFEATSTHLEMKLAELLKHYQEGPMLCFNSLFLDTSRDAALGLGSSADAVFNKMESYYAVSKASHPYKPRLMKL